MIIAVACNGLAIASRFIQCTSFMCYTVERGVIIGGSNIPAFDRQPEKLAELFDAIEAKVIITGSIDDDIASLIEAHGLKVVRDAKGDPLSAVRTFLA